jgi:hypothetical protein
MAEQFDVKLAEEARFHTPRPEYREKPCVRDHNEDMYGRFLKDPEAFWAKVAKELDGFSKGG